MTCVQLDVKSVDVLVEHTEESDEETNDKRAHY